MLYFTNNNTISAIKRQVYLSGKSSYVSVAAANGYLRPLSEEQAAANGFQYGNGFSLIVEVVTDIREGDKVTVDGTEYTVRGVVNHNRGGITAYKRCLMLRPQTA